LDHRRTLELPALEEALMTTQKLQAYHLRLAIVTVSVIALSGCMGVGVMGQPAGEYDEELVVSDAGTGEDPDEVVDGGDGAVDDDSGEPEPVEDAAPVEEDAAPALDTGPEVEEDTGPVECTYPTGPYDFDVNQIVEPMSWSGAASVDGDGTGADLETFFCDPEVSSIFIYVGNTT
jgi:hypothetical protein